MVGVDTNIVVRLLTQDDAKQGAKARRVFERESVLLAKTVLLESEWVLRSLYGFERSRIADSFAALIALPDVSCEDLRNVKDAIEWTRKGMDFADAIHLASARAAGNFATFDGKLRQLAAELTDITTVRL
jgi:predicted nucleic-acid-binding protein